jgi:hypothetical protein
MGPNLVRYSDFGFPAYHLQTPAPCARVNPFDGSAWVASNDRSGIWIVSIGAPCNNGLAGMTGKQAARVSGNGDSFYQDISAAPQRGSCVLTFSAWSQAPNTLAVAFSGATVATVQPPSGSPTAMRQFSVAFTVTRELP